MNLDYRQLDKYRIWLCVHCKNSSTAKKLTSAFGDAEGVFRELAHLQANGLKGVAKSIISSLAKSDPDKVYEELGEKVIKGDIDVMLYDDAHYPDKLRICPDAPSILFLRGNMIPSVFCSIGIVGTRNYTEQGAELTDKYANRISIKKAIVVSGMANGIDTIAAKSALRVHSNLFPTIAVLGSGVDVPAPAENHDLYEEIVEEGAVVSQFMPGEQPTRYTYPIRNKVIAGLSDALLVIEAGKTSGALITANAAIKYGRRVYAIPARLTDRTFAGSNLMLREQRAIFADEAIHFLESVYDDEHFSPGYEIPDMDFAFSGSSDEEREVAFLDTEIEKYYDERELLYKMLDADGKRIYNALVDKDMTFDELVFATGLPVCKLNYTLAMMELKKQVIQIYGRKYRLLVYENTPRL